MMSFLNDLLTVSTTEPKVWWAAIAMFGPITIAWYRIRKSDRRLKKRMRARLRANCNADLAELECAELRRRHFGSSDIYY